MFQWFRRHPRLAATVTLYTRDDCPLCVPAAAFLRREQRRLGFTLTTVDIARDPALADRYGDRIPVVEVNGRERFRGAISPVLWQRLVTALTRRGES